VTFSVTVTPNGSANPSGQLQLYDNGQTLGSAAQVIGGIASFVITSLPVGAHTITAHYLGDSHTLPSTSAPITQLIAGTVAMQVTGSSNNAVETADFSVTLQ
jgi:Bacterial Ig-like domain (group 3)